MSKAPFVCDCGVKTTEPFRINGQYFCALCAEVIAPRLVNAKAARNWREFRNGNQAWKFGKPQRGDRDDRN